MGRLLVLVMLVMAAPAEIRGQTLVVLHIRAGLGDPGGQQVPLARHALLISDEPQTRETRRIVTRSDGTADIRLRPGTYIVESDQPVTFQGSAYRWRQSLVIGAGGDSTLDLTVTNAIIEPIQPGATDAGAAPAADTVSLQRRWLASVVELWTPTAHASGFLVDAAGLIATSQKVIGDATSVEVQISRSLKVAGTVLAADQQQDIAIIRIDPAAMASITPVPLGCGRGTTPPLASGQEVFTLAAPLRQQKGWTPGTVTRADGRVIASELALASGGAGGPVFSASGDLVGITTREEGREEPRRGVTPIVRIDGVCEIISTAATTVKDAPAPGGTHLPVEPVEPAPVAAFAEAVKRRAGSLKPYQMEASEFDVTFITPILNFAAQSQATAGFSNWSEYVAEIPRVLFVRVTPKMEESFWAKVARGAAYTQGMALPALKRLKAGFLRLQAYCGRAEVLPIHPFKLELRVSQTDAVHEGLYVFDPAALGPGCGTVTLVLYSEKEPEKADTRVIDPGILQQIWRDFESGRTP